MNKNEKTCKYIISCSIVFSLIIAFLFFGKDTEGLLGNNQNNQEQTGYSILLYINNEENEYQELCQEIADKINTELTNRGNTVTTSSTLEDGYDFIFEICLSDGESLESGIITKYYQEDYEKLAGSIQDATSLATYATNHGIHYESLDCNLTLSIIVGNSLNTQEMESLTSSVYQEKIALGIANGIDEYLEYSESI